jgi:hypothetical protein
MSSAQEIFEAFLKCPTKAYLYSARTVGIQITRIIFIWNARTVGGRCAASRGESRYPTRRLGEWALPYTTRTARRRVEMLSEVE